METVDIVKLFGTGGFAVALLGLLYVVGMRIVAALDKVTNTVTEQHRDTRETINDHTRQDVAAQGAVVDRLSYIEGKLEESINWTRPTPVEEQVIRRTPPRGVTASEYRVVGRRDKP